MPPKANATSFKSGNQHPNWKGGKRIVEGYVVVRTEDGEYVLEHRLIFEQHYGIKLSSRDQIHHINGIRSDNRIENLQLVSRSEHMRLHTTGRVRSEEERKRASEIRQGWNQKECHQQWKANVTKEAIEEALRAYSTKNAAAKHLGICVDSLRMRMNYYGMPIKRRK